tara:strand:+ start:665 stop:961 length:297 start_codon:yes stop_codon:yes gene_type:complete
MGRWKERAERRKVSGMYEPILTSRYLSKYELSKLVGILELDFQKNVTTYELAGVSDVRAFCLKKILDKDYDVVISRSLPNNGNEDVHLRHLHTEHLRV